MRHTARFSILLIITVIVSMLLTFEVTLKPVMGSTTTKLYPIADADVNSANPDANCGSSIRLNISFNSKLSYAYVTFDLSSIPSEARITSANFNLYLMSVSGVGPWGKLKVGTHYCPDNSWTELGITWNNKPDFEPKATAVRSFGAFVSVKRYYSWKITADVATALWYGKLTEVVKFEPNGDWGVFKFHSKDTSTGDRSVASPFLEVEYTIPFSSTISCSVEPAIIEFGQTVNVSGGISPPHSGVEVTLTYTRPDGSPITRAVTATATGNYNDLYTPDRVVPWSVHASWAGDEDHAGAKSPKALFTVTKASSLISCTLPSFAISIGEGVAMSGSISPPRPGATVYLQHSTDGGETWNSITSVTADSASLYSYTWTPPSLGSYLIQSYWNGDDEYNGAHSTAQSLVVEKAGSTISCSASPTSIINGSNTKISGSITPAVAEATVTIYYRVSGENWRILFTVTTTSTGGYAYTWTPTSVRTYEVKASWAGDANHHGAESDVVTVTVTEEPFLLWIILGVALVVIASIAVITLLRKRKSSSG